MAQNLTTTQTADELRTALAVDGMEPSITTAKVSTLFKAKALEDVSTTSRFMASAAGVEAFLDNTRYVPDIQDLLALATNTYRVSVLEREDRHSIRSIAGHTVRYAGVDFSDDPLGEDEIGGWVGFWPVKTAIAEQLAQERGLILASCRGYVGPDHVRTVVDFVRDGGRTFFVTERAPETVREFIGGGIWIDVDGGPISALISE